MKFAAWREHLPGIVGVLVVAVLATAVGGVVWWLNTDDDSKANYGRAERPTSSVSPSGKAEAPPKFPDAAREPTKEGAEAAVRFEIAALNYGQRTGDFEPLRLVYDLNECDACKLAVEDLSDRLSDGSKYVDAEYTLISLQVAFTPGDDGKIETFVQLTMKQDSEHKLLNNKNQEIKKYSPMPETNFSYQLKYESNRWIITGEYPGEQT